MRVVAEEIFPVYQRNYNAWAAWIWNAETASDFEAFATALGASRLTDDLLEIELNQSPGLIIGWCKAAKEFLSVELPGGV